MQLTAILRPIMQIIIIMQIRLQSIHGLRTRISDVSGIELAARAISEK